MLERGIATCVMILAGKSSQSMSCSLTNRIEDPPLPPPKKGGEQSIAPLFKGGWGDRNAKGS
jgi:hypothetical protein